MQKYIDCFQWRNSRYIPVDCFEELLNKYPCSPEDLWPMLIGNSVKVSHPFNADFLHRFLLRYNLNKRDYLWTIYINKLPSNDTDRLVQLIQMYDRGDEIILRKFENVNDPYIIQRLYGIVFGACCKRTDERGIQDLAEYVYHTVFEQEKVYPDILLRDYARLIIERFLYEHPEYTGMIERKKIVPPYNSDPIPEIEDQRYLEKHYDGAMFWLIHSMRFEGMGMYGDFGRYVFQSALHSFDVDDKKMFNYAV